MKTEKKTPTGDYETGYCRPPKAHQFTSENNPRKKRRASRAGDDGKFDPVGFFAKSVAITLSGEEQRVSKYEVLVRARVKAALKDGQFKSMQYLLKRADEHGLLEEAPEPIMRGGVCSLCPVGLRRRHGTRSSRRKATARMLTEQPNPRATIARETSDAT